MRHGWTGQSSPDQAFTEPQRLPFDDRRDAGRRLAARLDRFRDRNAIVLGIPRGGVPVAAEVARALNAELDVIVARKLGAPHNPELAIGAATANGGRWLNDEIVHQLHVSPAYIAEVTTREMAEAHRREHLFRAGRKPPVLAGRTVILVDDGLATGATMRASARSVRTHDPERLVIAVPVGAPETCDELRNEADEVVCLAEPTPFYAVGLHYRDFGQTEDDEVVRLLQERAAAT
ncbi:MAG TPA: phosphoribosyltransferase [Gemmatimonadaceae bacterium]|nr:phosphoribosyltransferase [Gemmatimonadaceae bacterium]